MDEISRRGFLSF